MGKIIRLTSEANEMRKQTAVVEWVIAQNDADWQGLRAPLLPDNEPTASRRQLLKRYFWIVAALLLLLAGAGEWWRRSTAASFHAATAELRPAGQQQPLAVVTPGRDSLVTRIMNERTNTDWWLQYGWGDLGVNAIVQTAVPTASLGVAVQAVEILGDQAVARVVTTTQNGATAYRQTRFYQRMGLDWRQTDPDATLWGSERRLETPSFVFHFRQNDAPTVIAVAPQIEELYTTLRGNFGLTSKTDAEKLVIEVSVTQPPGNAYVRLYGSAVDLRVPSPALYWAPVELTDVELLLQSIALPLLNHLLAQANEYHAIGGRRQPIVNGLYLWQVWELDLPLAVWREEIVKWIYIDIPSGNSGQEVKLPAKYPDLCVTHKLWLPSPVAIGIPLLCSERDWLEWHPSAWDPRDSLTRLGALDKSTPSDEYIGYSGSRYAPHRGQAVALATLIEYAVATYGRERLPALMAGLGQYDTWDTLLPAVYGVSRDEFEAGWHAYLAVHYGVAVDGNAAIRTSP